MSKERVFIFFLARLEMTAVCWGQLAETGRDTPPLICPVLTVTRPFWQAQLIIGE